MKFFKGSYEGGATNFLETYEGFILCQQHEKT